MTTSFNVCIDPYNEDLQADQLTLSISVHRAAAPERVEVTARGRASRASTRTCRASPPTSRLVAILRRLAAPVRPWWPQAGAPPRGRRRHDTWALFSCELCSCLCTRVYVPSRDGDRESGETRKSTMNREKEGRNIFQLVHPTFWAEMIAAARPAHNVESPRKGVSHLASPRGTTTALAQIFF